MVPLINAAAVLVHAYCPTGDHMVAYFTAVKMVIKSTCICLYLSPQCHPAEQQHSGDFSALHAKLVGTSQLVGHCMAH